MLIGHLSFILLISIHLDLEQKKINETLTDLFVNTQVGG